jgi:hypothetical protein
MLFHSIQYGNLRARHPPGVTVHSRASSKLAGLTSASYPHSSTNGQKRIHVPRKKVKPNPTFKSRKRPWCSTAAHPRSPWSSTIVRVDAVPVSPAWQPFGIANEPTFHRSVAQISLAVHVVEESHMVAYILFWSEDFAKDRCLPLLGDVSVPFVHLHCDTLHVDQFLFHPNF